VHLLSTNLPNQPEKLSTKIAFNTAIFPLRGLTGCQTKSFKRKRSTKKETQILCIFCYQERKRIFKWVISSGRKFALHNARTRFYEKEKTLAQTPHSGGKEREILSREGIMVSQETIEETVSTCSSSLPRNESASKMPEDETSGFLEDQSSEGTGDKNTNTSESWTRQKYLLNCFSHNNNVTFLSTIRLTLQSRLSIIKLLSFLISNLKWKNCLSSEERRFTDNYTAK